jgi:hypothetical protein
MLVATTAGTDNPQLGGKHLLIFWTSEKRYRNNDVTGP